MARTKRINSRTPRKKGSRGSNDNMRTRAWGPPAWFYLTSVAMGYPLSSPTRSQRQAYKQFFTAVGDTLPCTLCRDSYKLYVKQSPLTSTVLSGRRRLVMWLFHIHNKVNAKLKCKKLTPKELQKKYQWYDQFRAVKCSPEMGGCIKPLNRKKYPQRILVVPCKDDLAVKYTTRESARDQPRKRQPRTSNTRTRKGQTREGRTRRRTARASKTRKGRTRFGHQIKNKRLQLRYV